MPEPPFAITEKEDITGLAGQTEALIGDIYQERLGGAEIGDVFTVGDDDVLSLQLATNSGLQKTSSKLAVGDHIYPDATDGLKIGDDTNYTQIAADGEITLHGTARVLDGEWVPANGIRAPGTKPAVWVEHGISGVWQFADGDDKTLVATLKVPEGMDKTVAPTILIGWSANGISPGNCEWQAEYLWTAPGDDTTAAAQDTETIAVAASSTSDGLVVSETLGLDLPSATDACLHVRLKRLAGAGTNDTIVDTVEFHGICLRYTRNKLGTAT